MKKAIIICCYFGQLPKTFHVWADSCAKNPDYDFLLITDQNEKSAHNNLRIVHLEFKDVQERVFRYISKDASISTAYKMCDYKPAFGLVFADYISGYPFWGHCDIDMVFGDLKAFFTEDVFARYDKILYLGHLSLYRNVEKINNACLANGIYGTKVLTLPENYGFDEDQGIYRDFLKANIPVFDKRIFFDIYPFEPHMELDNVINRRMGKNIDRNYKQQLFFWFNGKVYRGYFDARGIKRYEEAVYIHMGRSQIIRCKYNVPYNTMIFTKKEIGTYSFNDINDICNKETIAANNPYNPIKSLLSFVNHNWSKAIRKLKRIIMHE